MHYVPSCERDEYEPSRPKLQGSAGSNVLTMRCVSLALLVLLSSCASCPRPQVGLGAPRVANQATGMPQPIFDDSSGLLDEHQVRQCQVLFEPSFGNRHAVWIGQTNPDGGANVFVRVRTPAGTEAFSAPLDAATATRLSRLCLAALSARSSSCERLGVDGVWYHAAHPAPVGGYVMASFWSPRHGSIADAFVKFAEALRDYATLPQALRAAAWLRLDEAARALSKLLSPGVATSP